MGLVLSLSLLEEDESEDELLDRELEPELELLDDRELDELLSDELLLLSLLLDPDAERFFRSLPFSFFLSLLSGSESVPGFAISNICCNVELS